MTVQSPTRRTSALQALEPRGPEIVRRLTHAGEVVGRLVLVPHADGVPPDLEVEAPPLLPPIPPETEIAVYRTATEAVANAARHSGGRHCRIRLCAEDAELVRDVCDDGAGLPPRTVPEWAWRRWVPAPRPSAAGSSCAAASRAARGCAPASRWSRRDRPVAARPDRRRPPHVPGGPAGDAGGPAGLRRRGGGRNRVRGGHRRRTHPARRRRPGPAHARRRRRRGHQRCPPGQPRHAGAAAHLVRRRAGGLRGVARRSAAPRSRPFPELTDREFDVLECLARGLATETAARRLGLSAKTVRNNVSNVLVKLGVVDRTAAARLAHQRGVGIDG